MQKLTRKYTVPGALPSRGRITQPAGRLTPRVSSALPRMPKRAPQQFMDGPHTLMPDIPPGVVLDGNITHIKSAKPTIQTKYIDKQGA